VLAFFTGMSESRRGYPSDVTDDEWAFAAPYLTLLREDAHQRRHDLRAVFDALRWLVKTGAHWRYLPNDFPPWPAVYQQARRWLAAGCFEAMAHDLRQVIRAAAGRSPCPTAAVLDGRTIQSTPESGARAGYDGYKRRRGSKVHVAVDTLGLLLALRVTAASEQERAQVFGLAADVQAATGQAVTLAFVDQGYTGDQPAADAAAHGIRLAVVRLPEAKRGFVLLPRRWVVERSFGWLARFRRLARDYERTAEALAGWHWVAFTDLMLTRVVALAQEPLDPGP
jgi:transposase